MDAAKPPPEHPLVGEQAAAETAPGSHRARGRSRVRLLTAGTLIAVSLAVLVALTTSPGAPSTAAPAPPSTPPTAAAHLKPPAAGSHASQGSPPLHIAYAGVGMDQEILPLTPPPGQASIVPPVTVHAYWLTSYGSPGSADTTYIIGHSWEGRDTAFNHLSTRAKPGDRIIITTKTGSASYAVKTVTTENKDTLKDSPIWNKVPNRLILISCYTADLWGTNIIITADRTSAP